MSVWDFGSVALVGLPVVSVPADLGLPTSARLGDSFILNLRILDRAGDDKNNGLVCVVSDEDEKFLVKVVAVAILLSILRTRSRNELPVGAPRTEGPKI